METGRIWQIALQIVIDLLKKILSYITGIFSGEDMIGKWNAKYGI